MLPPPTLPLLVAQRFDDVVERQIVFGQPGRIEQHVVLLFVAAPGVHFGHARHGAQLGLDHPMVDRAQFGQIVAVAADAGSDRLRPGRWRSGPARAFARRPSRADSALAMRSLTSCRARRMSVPSSNTAVRLATGRTSRATALRAVPATRRALARWVGDLRSRCLAARATARRC